MEGSVRPGIGEEVWRAGSVRSRDRKWLRTESGEESGLKLQKHSQDHVKGNVPMAGTW